MAKARHIKQDGTIEYPEPKDGKKFSLEELQGFVGGYIELVRVTTKQVMYVNEEGRLRGLRYNAMASIIAGQLILGDVIVLDKKDA